jgi:aldose 1-epimerase
VRQAACFPLVPYSNRIAGGRFRFDGRTFHIPINADHCSLPLHGLGWQRRWSIVAHGDSEATIAFDHSPIDAEAAWPFSFRVEQTVRLSIQGMELELSVENRDFSSQPVGLGWHPYFPRGARTRLTAAVAGMWQADAECLPVSRVPLMHPLRAGVDLAEINYDNCFFGFDGAARVEWPERDLAVNLRADPALSHLVLYTPPDRRFFAVEPVSHMTDALNRSSLCSNEVPVCGVDHATGLRVLAPGMRLSVRMQLLPERLAHSQENATHALMV